MVDSQRAQTPVDDRAGQRAVAPHLRVVAHPPHQPDRHARGAAGAARQPRLDLRRQLHRQQRRAAVDDLLQFLLVVQVEPCGDAESRVQRGRHQPGLGSGADQREARQRYLDGAGARPLADDHVDLVILHRGVQQLLDRRPQPVDLVDEEDVVPAQAGEDRHQVRGLLQGGRGRAAKLDAELVGDDRRQRRLAEPRRPGEEDVIERFAAVAGGAHEHAQVLAELLLADEVGQQTRPQPYLFAVDLTADLVAAGPRRHDAVAHREAPRS